MSDSVHDCVAQICPRLFMIVCLSFAMGCYACARGPDEYFVELHGIILLYTNKQGA